MMMDAFQEALALTEQIHREMMNPNQTLDEMSKYYFDGQGKAVRPALTLIMAGACNSHLQVNIERSLRKYLHSEQQAALNNESVWPVSAYQRNPIIIPALACQFQVSRSPCLWFTTLLNFTSAGCRIGANRGATETSGDHLRDVPHQLVASR